MKKGKRDQSRRDLRPPHRQSAKGKSEKKKKKRGKRRTGGLGDDVVVEVHDDATNGLAVSGHVEENFDDHG